MTESTREMKTSYFGHMNNSHHKDHSQGLGVCLRQNSMFTFTEHHHLFHMSRLLQLDGGTGTVFCDGGEENGGLMVNYNTA